MLNPSVPLTLYELCELVRQIPADFMNDSVLLPRQQIGSSRKDITTAEANLKAGEGRNGGGHRWPVWDSGQTQHSPLQGEDSASEIGRANLSFPERVTRFAYSRT